MNLIKLSYKIGIPIVNYLRAIGIEPRKDISGGLSFQFTEEELDKVLDIKMDEPTSGCLEGLEHCHNLKSLKVDNSRYSAYESDNMSISDKDIKVISKLKSLETLSITRQKNISWVDVTDLENLKQLTIVRNNSIDIVYGLEKLKKIKEVSIYGNKELYGLKGIVELINTNDIDILELDLLNFTEISDSFSKLNNIPSCNFIEACSGGIDLTYNKGIALLFHKKCLEIVKNILSLNPKNNLDIIILVEKYIAENIKYDYEALKKEDRYHVIDGVKRGKNFGTQSAYNGLMYGSCVCEGYTKSMQYLLKLLNVKTKSVSCIRGKDKIEIKKYGNQIQLPDDGYHSIIRIDNKEEIYYCDPCWDSCRWHNGDTTLPYCLKNRQDIERDHTLSFEEKNIIGIYNSVDQYYINSVINNHEELNLKR